MGKIKVAAIGVAVGLVAFATAGWTADPADTALAALDAGDNATARVGLAAEVARLSFLQALAEQGDARRAAAERAVALAPAGSWVSDAASALVADAAGKHDEALAALRRAAATAATEPHVWKILGDALAEQQNWPEARGAFEKSLALAPAYVPASLALGQLFRNIGDFAAAYNTYNHALDAAPRSVDALIGRAASRFYVGDRDGAWTDIDRAIAVATPGNDRYRALMTALYARTALRQLPQGLDRAEEAARMWADLGRADMVAATMNAAGRMLLETGDPTSGESWYDRAWQAVSGSSMAPAARTVWQVRWLHGKARCAAARRDFEAANGFADQARALMAADTANAEHYAWIGPYLDGYLALAERRYDEAIAALQKSDLERAHIRLLLGQAYAGARDRANARLWYQKALEAADGLDSESVIVRPVASAWLAKNR